MNNWVTFFVRDFRDTPDKERWLQSLQFDSRTYRQLSRRSIEWNKISILRTIKYWIITDFIEIIRDVS